MCAKHKTFSTAGHITRLSEVELFDSKHTPSIVTKGQGILLKAYSLHESQ